MVRRMSLIQSIDLARTDRIGPHGADPATLDATLARAEAALDWVRARYEDKTLPVLQEHQKQSQHLGSH